MLYKERGNHYLKLELSLTIVAYKLYNTQIKLLLISNMDIQVVGYFSFVMFTRRLKKGRITRTRPYIYL
jgi:hypothetical protein